MAYYPAVPCPIQYVGKYMSIKWGGGDTDKSSKVLVNLHYIFALFPYLLIVYLFCGSVHTDWVSCFCNCKTLSHQYSGMTGTVLYNADSQHQEERQNLFFFFSCVRWDMVTVIILSYVNMFCSVGAKWSRVVKTVPPHIRKKNYNPEDT